jgi:hypothetical protein
MNTHASKAQENKSQSISTGESQVKSSAESTFQFIDNRPEAVAQKRLQAMLNNSPRAMQAKAHQKMANESGDQAVKSTASRTTALLQRTNNAAPSFPVQRIGTDELKGRGMEMDTLAQNAPERGVNLWVATNPNLPASIYLLGTAHGLKLSEMGVDAAARQYLIDFLRTEPFTHVFTEVAAQLPGTLHVPDLAAGLEAKRAAVQALNQFPDGGPPSTERKEYIAYRRALNKVSTVETGLGGNDLLLDDAYLNLAHKPRPDIEAGPKVGALEDSSRRILAHETNLRDMGLSQEDEGHKLRRAPDEVISGNEDVVSGNQKTLFTDAAREALAGRDIASAEQRNKQWMKHVSPDNVKPGDKQLWIVGAAHLPGLVLRFSDIRWQVTHQAPPAAE